MNTKAGNLLKAQGYAILPLEGVKKKMKRIYYHPGTGLPTCPLPADKYHERRYLSRGFTLEPPIKQFTCDICGKEFTAKIALVGHKRTHEK